MFGFIPGVVGWVKDRFGDAKDTARTQGRRDAQFELQAVQRTLAVDAVTMKNMMMIGLGIAGLALFFVLRKGL